MKQINDKKETLIPVKEFLERANYSMRQIYRRLNTREWTTSDVVRKDKNRIKFICVEEFKARGGHLI